MSSRDDAEVLFANERFYAAFAAGDAGAMTALWGKEGLVMCMHPGWEPLVERNHVLASWTAILQTPPPIRCHVIKVVPQGDDGASVLCWEEINGHFIVATNAFRREADGWKIVHHQAGPSTGTPPKSEPTPTASTALN